MPVGRVISSKKFLLYKIGIRTIILEVKDNGAIQH